MIYAKVIVDVPAKQTNRPFDYIVPDRLRDWVEVGSRVGVPFGPRTVQGFVVVLHDEPEVATGKMKPIEQVLDVHPPLTKELVALSRWMSETYVCNDIATLQAMIPSALKAKYERYITLPDDPEALDASENGIENPAMQEIAAANEGEERESQRSVAQVQMTLEIDSRPTILDYVRKHSPVLLETLLSRFAEDAPLVKQMIGRGELVEQQTVKDRLAKKKALTVFPPEDHELLRQRMEGLSAQSRRQKEVLQYLLEHPEPVRLADLMVTLEVGAGTVKGLAEKGWISLKEVEVFRDPYAGRTFRPTTPLPLTPEQQSVYARLQSSIDGAEHRVFLLHGVTGSGKTEVYLQAIQRCLDLGREAIVLVPEISLTPQMVERFKGRFGDLVAVLHSRLSHGERYDEWRKIQERRVKVAIGARSAIFAPFTSIGLIIIDEEHETSYKQDESPKYHAKDVAIWRARYNNAAVVLGSATPSLETYYDCQADPERILLEGASPVELLPMPSRVEGRPLPSVEVVDMREELKGGNRSMFSRPLHQAIADRLAKGEQTVLLLNRRGYSTFVMCRSCGYVAGCPHCDISLTYHMKSRALRCHYCGYAERERETCPDCGSEHIRYFGTGTQRVEEELGKLFPGIRVIRMDVDTTTEKGSHEKWLELFRNRQADVLLGTQMVAKGLDFPYVTLVGVIAADTVLNIPDFRAGEKTFQLLTQVAGRAGRHHLPGEVIIQSYAPEHYSIQAASGHDYNAFVEQELELRRQRRYPPYCRIVLVTMSHEQVQLLVGVGENMAAILREKGMLARQPYLEVLGPVASPIPRIKDRYRFQCMIKYRGDAAAVIELVRQTVASFDDVVRQHKLQISVDVDPQMLT